MKKQYKVAVIGCGKIGIEEDNYTGPVKPGSHAAAWNTHKEAQVVALVDTDKTRSKTAQRYFPNVPFYTDLSKMLAKEKPDIVSVAVGSTFHRVVVEKTANAGVQAILCEKPIALSASDAQAMIGACKRHDTLLLVNHQRHFDPLILKWAKRVQAGWLGDIYQATGYYYNGLFTNGTHLIDLMRLFFGQPTSIIGSFNHRTSSHPLDPNVDGSLSFASGLRVSMLSLGKNYGYFGLRIYGEKGMIHITNLGYTVEFARKIENKYYKGYYQLENITKEGKERSFLLASTQYVLDCLKGKKPPISTGEDGCHILRILEGLQTSALRGRSVKVI